MAFFKTAKAKISEKKLYPDSWNDFKTKIAKKTKLDFKSVLSDYHPEKYLLTHCTIISSVNVDNAPKKNKLGRKDYYITPDTSKYVNDNGDAWEKALLLKTYRTFVGAYNFLEHVQIEEDPYIKGRIIDAVSRDLGDCVYVDILVATDRKHKDLVAKIENGEIDSLSMGANVQNTTCTKCGNVAADEPELCVHVKYLKKSFFIDDQGKKRIIAELCGHHTEKESNKFIEASYVVDPAFKGAVIRNIIIPDTMAEDTAKEIKKAYSKKVKIKTDDLKKAASKNPLLTELYKAKKLINAARLIIAQEGDEEGENEEEEETKHSQLPGGTSELREQNTPPREDAQEQEEDQEGQEGQEEPQEDQMGQEGQEGQPEEGQEGQPEEGQPEEGQPQQEDPQEYPLEKSILREILKEVERKNDPRSETVDTNNTLVRAFKSFIKKTALKNTKETKRLFIGLTLLDKNYSWEKLYKKGFTIKDVMNINYFLDAQGLTKFAISKENYKTLEKVSSKDYTSIEAFINKFEKISSKTLSKKEKKALVVKGSIIKLGFKFSKR